MPSRALVVDANILVRAVLGKRVRDVIAANAGNVLATRDPDDWPVLASALALGCRPIWTEDTDFFGCGVATWTTDRVQMFLRE